MPRLAVLKTHKLFINGQFPRTESGRIDPVRGPDGSHLANVCRASRKDVREAVKHARGALAKWSGSSAYLRGQILYRVAEILESRAAQFQEELIAQGTPKAAATAEVHTAIDRLVYYAGWTDKVQQVFGTVNPVASSHFNFSVVEPMGVVAVLAPDAPGLLGLVSLIAPALAGGNTVIAVASGSHPLSAVSFAEVMHASDVPAGAVNMLTGRRSELAPVLAGHMDVNAVVHASASAEERTAWEKAAVANVKRVVDASEHTGTGPGAESPYAMLETLETKTTWHPIGF